MSKLYTGSIGFSVGIVQKGAVPLDDRSVVRSFNDLLSAETFGLSAYEGMLVAVVEDQQVYMLVDKANATKEESWIAVGSGNGSLAVDTYAEAIQLATADNIGQIIYVKNESEYDADGEGEGASVKYDAAPYIVIGTGSLQKLAASTASGDIEGDVRALLTKVSTLETKLGNEENGLIKDVKDLQEAVDAIDYPVKDVKFNGETVVNDEGVAEITVDLTPYALQETVNGIGDRVTTLESSKVDVTEGYRLMAETEGDKLETIQEGAQVNIIESIKVNGNAIEIAEDKSVNIPIETIKVKNVDSADKMLTLTENGEVKSELSITYLKSEDSGDGKPYIALYGKGGTTLISSLDATDFIKDGMLSGVELVDTADSKKALRLTWNTDGGKETVDVDVTELIDYYYAGNGIALGDDRKFSIDLKEGEKFLVVDASGLGIDESTLWATADEKYDQKNAAKNALDSAKIYADELNTAMDTRVKSLESIDHNIYAKSEDVYTKEVADSTFVKIENLNEFTKEYEDKLVGIEDGAQVNIIDNVSINGINATIENKTASVKVDADDIELGTAIKNGEENKYEADTKLSVVLQGIQDSIRGAIAGGVNSVLAGDTAISINNADANNPVVSLNVETATETTIAEGHIELIKSNEGVYGVMYYGGDDAE